MKIDRFLRSMVLVAAMLGACGEDTQPPSDEPEKPDELSLRLAEDALWLRRGEAASVSFSLEPAEALETIAIVRARDLPEGVTAADVVLEPGAGAEGALVLTASSNARTGGPQAIEVEAVVGDVTRTATLDLTVAGLPGELDVTFGDGGIVRHDEEQLLAGSFDGFTATDSAVYALTNASHAQLARMHLDGSIDRNFGTQGFVTFEFEGGTGSRCTLSNVDPQRVLVACFNLLNQQDLAIIVQRLLEDGRPDLTFGRNGSLEIPIDPDWSTGYYVRAVSDSMNRLLIATTALHRATSERLLLVWRATSEGELDPDWGDGSVVTIKRSDFLPLSIDSMSVHFDGTGIIIAGYSTSGGGYTIAIDDQGRTIESFGTSGVVRHEDGVHNIALSDESGTIFVNEWKRIVALTPSGHPKPGFGVDGVLEFTDSRLNTITPGPGGSVLGAGYWKEPGRSGPMLFRFSGGLDSAFSERSRLDGLPNQVTAEAVVATPDGRFLVALRHYPLTENHYFGIARFWQ